MLGRAQRLTFQAALPVKSLHLRTAVRSRRPRHAGTRCRRARPRQLDSQRRARRRLARTQLDARRCPATALAALNVLRRRRADQRPPPGLRSRARAPPDRSPPPERTLLEQLVSRNSGQARAPALTGFDARGLARATPETAGVLGRLRDFSFHPGLKHRRPPGVAITRPNGPQHGSGVWVRRADSSTRVSATEGHPPVTLRRVPILGLRQRQHTHRRAPPSRTVGLGRRR